MKKIFAYVTIFVMCTLSAHAATAIQGASADVATYFANLQGIVISVDGDQVIIDIGSEKNAIKGLKLKVYSDGEAIVHPITGQLLGHRQSVSGTLTVTKVESGFSYATYSKEYKPVVKNKVALELPVNVEPKFTDTTDADKSVIANLLTANTVLANGKDYTVNLVRNDDMISYQIVQKDGIVIFAGNASDVVQKESNMAVLSNHSIDGGRFVSIAMGRFYKDDKNLYLVGATEDEVTIFDPKKNYAIKEKIDLSFARIATVDVADLNNDGVDEIFVSDIRTTKSPVSKILSHNGKEFTLVKGDIPFFFRSVRNGTKRDIYTQTLSKEGLYMGEVYKLVYKDGNYVQGDSVKGSLGKSLFGFSVLPVLKDNNQQMLNIDINGKFTVSSLKGVEYSSKDYFGDTFNRFTVRTNTTINNMTEEEKMVSVDKMITVRPRIEVLGDDSFAIVTNNLYSRAFMNSQVFTESFLNVFTYQHGVMTPKYTSPSLNPVLADIWAYEEDGQKYLVTLTSSNDWFMQRGKSSLTIFKLP